MALTFLSSNNGFIQHTPAPSLESPPSLQVPNVFVIPPEEEQTESPPFCCFDAAEVKRDSASTAPNMECVNVALSILRQTQKPTPIFHRPNETEMEYGIAMPRRADGRCWNGHSVACESHCAVKEGRRYYEPGEDSEIVEVVKVRRNDGMNDISDSDTLKKVKTKSLRSRASRVFKSIKNVGKGGRRLDFKEGYASSAEYRGSLESASTQSSGFAERAIFDRPATPQLSRQKSRQFTNIFTFSQSNRSASKVATPTSLPITSRSGVGATTTCSATSSSTLEDILSSQTLSTLEEPARTASPTLSKKRSFRNRLSILNINRYFTPSVDSADDISAARRTPTPYPIPTTPISPDFPQFSPSIASPMDGLESATDIIHLSPVLPSSSLQLSSFSSLGIPGQDTVRNLGRWRGQQDEDEDEDLEMRLDSLHFDSLHFDAEDFNVSLS